MFKKMSAADVPATGRLSSDSSYPLSLDEITIVMRPSGIAMTHYIGTRMQLEAEGVVPVGTAWPDAFSSVCWKAGGLEFQLKRERPEGAKGRRRDFLDCDNWCLRVASCDPSWSEDVVELQKQKLAKMLYERTPEGRAEWTRKFEAYWAAKCDEKFQSFKVLVPGLVPTSRRGRRSSAR